jgi:hypothetical protein
MTRAGPPLGERWPKCRGSKRRGHFTTLRVNAAAPTSRTRSPRPAAFRGGPSRSSGALGCRITFAYEQGTAEDPSAILCRPLGEVDDANTGEIPMGAVQLGKRRGAGGLVGVRAPHRPLAKLSVILRYVLAVPFLAVGAALLTIGALIAGTSSPPRKSGGRAQRDPANGQYRC